MRSDPRLRTAARDPGKVAALLLGLLVVGAGSWAGCGKAEETPIVSFFTMEYTARTATDWKELEKRFNESHDDVQLSITVADWGSAKVKLENLVKDGEQPDLATLPADWFLKYYADGHLAPLDNLTSKDFLSRFHPAALRTGTVAGRRYALPFGLDVRFLYVNRKMLSATTGATESPPAPTTWDELAQAARAMQALSDDVREAAGLPAQSYGMGLPLTPKEAPNTFAYFLWTAGGRFFDDEGNVAFDSPEGRQALTFIAELVSTGDATNPDPLTFGRETLEALFRTEKLGLLITGHWLRATILEERSRVRFSQEPLPVRSTRVVPVACDYLVLFAKSEQRKEAWQFVDFLYQPENRRTESGWIFLDPQQGKSRIPELAALLEAMPDQVFWKEIRAALELARFMPLEAAWPEVSEVLAKEIVAACTGEKSPEEALADAAQTAQELIDNRRKGPDASS